AVGRPGHRTEAGISASSFRPRSSLPSASSSSRRVRRNKVCAAGARWSPPGSVLGRAHIYGYGRSLRPPQGTTSAPRRRAVFRQTLLDPDQLALALFLALRLGLLRLRLLGLDQPDPLLIGFAGQH